MKKRPLSFALAVCLGAMAPAVAADASGLDAAGAKAFANQLTAYRQTVLYADLRDMNGDRSPELIVVSSPEPDGNGFAYHNATVDIWQIQKGAAVKTTSAECEAGMETEMSCISLGGTLCIRASAATGHPGYHGVTDTYISADGWERLAAWWNEEPAGMASDSLADENNSTDFSHEASGSGYKAITRDEYRNLIQKYRGASVVGDAFLEAGGQSWYREDGLQSGQHDPTYQTVWNRLSARANAAPAASAGANGSAAGVGAGGFTDVAAGEYYAGAVKWAVENKITSGTTATTFSPDQTCTVAQILTFLWQANGAPEPVSGNPFRDVSRGDYYDKAAVWAAGEGLVSGSWLNPNAPCTRSMVVTYLWKLAGSPSAAGGGSQFAPYGITCEDSAGDTVTIEFDAVTTKTGTVTICQDAFSDMVDVYHPAETREQTYTIITARPNSNMTVRGGDPYKQTGPDTIDGFGDIRMDADGVLHYRSDWDTPSYLSSQTIADSGCVIADKYLVVPDTAAFASITGTAAQGSNFADVPANAEYAEAVAWAVGQGITSGTDAASFSPNMTCTRGQIVTFLHRALGQ